MSAFCSLIHEDRIELLTDGAIYEPDGTLVAIREKVWRSTFVPLAVTGRGNAVLVEAMASAIIVLSACGSFDGTMQGVIGMLDRRRGSGSPEPFEMLICGMSESEGPRQSFFASGEFHEGVSAWTMIDPGPHLCAGVAPEGLTLDLDDDAPTLERHGVSIFEAFRAEKGPNPAHPDRPAIHGVGGHVDLTTITASGAMTRRLHTWPDVVGEKIWPLPSSQSLAA